MTGTFQCDPGKVKVTEKPVQLVIENYIEWNVTVANECFCAESNVVLPCKGFQSISNVDPTVFTKQDDSCFINKDSVIPPYSSVSFTYAWDHPFNFTHASSQEVCS
ncbi:hypothetical protein LguiA_036517 [Lonicera macranthoides]